MEIYEQFEMLMQETGGHITDEWATFVEKLAEPNGTPFGEEVRAATTLLENSLSFHIQRLARFAKTFNVCMTAGPGCAHTEDDHQFMLWAFDRPQQAKSLLQKL